jgi:hypothetical protein
MAHLCTSEATLFKHRAESCWARATRRAAWGETGEDAETLRCCPYPSDSPQNGSWTEQAAVWDRAARKSLRAAEWHSQMREYYGGWTLSLFAPRRP